MESAGIYLFVDFDWPRPVSSEVAQKARQLHDVVQDQDWIQEIVAASGGIGSGPASNWVFWLENYAALDRLLRNYDDDVAQAYSSFFAEMPLVVEKIREQVVFL